MAKDDNALSGKETIRDYDYPDGKTLRIPEGETSILANAYAKNKDIECVIIPEGVEVIEESAFFECPNLKEVIFPKSLIEIKRWAFKSCPSLEKADLPEGLETIGSGVFSRCPRLHNVVLPSSLKFIDGDAFYGCESIEEIIFPEKIEDLYFSTFADCKNLKRVVFLGDVDRLTSTVFMDDSNLETVEFKGTVNLIGKSVFEGCSKLSNIDLPDTVTTVWERAFAGCASLTKLNLSNVETVEKQAFLGCENLAELGPFPKLERVESETFAACKKLEELSIPDADFVGEKAFRNCSSLRELELPEDVTFKGKDHFVGCPNLSEEFYQHFDPPYPVPEVLPAHENQELLDKLLYSIKGKEMILHDIQEEWKGKVEELNIPESWNVIAVEAEHPQQYMTCPSFNECKALKKVRLPSTLQRIEDAFCYCDNLEEVILPKKLMQMGCGNFSDCPKLEKVTMPEALKSMGYWNFQNTPLREFPENLDEDGNFYLGSYLVEGNKDAKGVHVREGTTLIAASAFCESGLYHVDFPSSLRYIGAEAFADCDYLSEPEIPASIEYIADDAFPFELDAFVSVRGGKIWGDGTFELLEQQRLTKAKLEILAEEIKDLVLKIDTSYSSSYDDSDDDRVTPSEYHSSSSSYRRIEPMEDSKHLIVIGDHIRGIVIEASHFHGDDTEHVFLFDGSVQQSIYLGYSASHSSQSFDIHKIIAVKAGEGGAPIDPPKMSYRYSDSDSSL